MRNSGFQIFAAALVLLGAYPASAATPFSSWNRYFSASQTPCASASWHAPFISANAIDLRFESSEACGVSYNAFDTGFERASVENASNAGGAYFQFTSGVPAITTAGAYFQAARVNTLYDSRDLSQPAWIKGAAITVRPDVDGFDNTRKASQIKATAAGQTICQAYKYVVTAAANDDAAARATSLFIKGALQNNIEISQDNGVTWTAITPQQVSSEKFTRFGENIDSSPEIPGQVLRGRIPVGSTGTANEGVCIKFDGIDTAIIDNIQNEAVGNIQDDNETVYGYSSGPIVTAKGTSSRQIDRAHLLATSYPLIQSPGGVTVYVEFKNLMNDTAGTIFNLGTGTGIYPRIVGNFRAPRLGTSYQDHHTGITIVDDTGQSGDTHTIGCDPDVFRPTGLTTVNGIHKFAFSYNPNGAGAGLGEITVAHNGSVETCRMHFSVPMSQIKDIEFGASWSAGTGGTELPTCQCAIMDFALESGQRTAAQLATLTKVATP